MTGDLERSAPPPANCDLHLHTCWSYDALADIEPYFRRARETGLRAIAITDHHVIDGLGEAADIAQRYPEVRLIRGAELSVHCSIGAVDLVCLGLPDVIPPALAEVLDDYHAWQVAAGRAISLGMQAIGFDYTDAHREALLRRYRPARAIDLQGITHVRNGIHADYFVERGFAENAEGYHDVRRRAAQAVPTPPYPAAEKVVPAVKAAGGVVAMAHPSSYVTAGDTARLDMLCDELSLDGIECAHPALAADLREFCVDHCRRRGLLMTAGSDCHVEEQLDTLFARHGGDPAWLDPLLDRLPSS